MKPKPVTLAALRRAAPKGFIVDESRFERHWYCGVLNKAQDIWAAASYPDRQIARRMALAALKAMGEKKP